VTPAELAAELVAIDSVNPDLVPGGAGEGEAAAFVAERLAEARLDVEVVEAAGGRPSVVAIARGAAAAGRSSSTVTSTRSASRAWTSRSGRGPSTGSSTDAAHTT
jgi:acetylornithine deacetylase/succinyl-diaminopimelate desuccinylase-like protein